MIDTSKIAALIEECSKEGKVVIIAPEPPTAQPTAQTLDFETERRKDVINRLCGDIANKRVSLVLVAEWTRKKEDYCRRNIKQRSNYTNTAWAVDVLQFVCKEWQLPLPYCYEMQLEKFRRQDERKKNAMAMA
jgi:hypothetical protein